MLCQSITRSGICPLLWKNYTDCLPERMRFPWSFHGFVQFSAGVWSTTSMTFASERASGSRPSPARGNVMAMRSATSATSTCPGWGRETSLTWIWIPWPRGVRQSTSGTNTQNRWPNRDQEFEKNLWSRCCDKIKTFVYHENKAGQGLINNFYVFTYLLIIYLDTMNVDIECDL